MATGKGDEGRSESCNATLRINEEAYEGSTGRDHGHAEMDALDYFIRSDPGETGSVSKSIQYCANLINDKKTRKTVSCPSRDICLKCTSALQQLGFETAVGTKWSDTPMGKTEWGASAAVQRLFKECGVDYETIKSLS